MVLSVIILDSRIRNVNVEMTGGRGVDPGVTSLRGVVEPKVTWGDKGREGGQKVGNLG